MIVDCDTCQVRGPACSDCVVSVLLGPPRPLADDDKVVLGFLAGHGLVPPLRHVAAVPVATSGPTGSVTPLARPDRDAGATIGEPRRREPRRAEPRRGTRRPGDAAATG